MACFPGKDSENSFFLNPSKLRLNKEFHVKIEIPLKMRKQRAESVKKHIKSIKNDFNILLRLFLSFQKNVIAIQCHYSAITVQITKSVSHVKFTSF